jgi:Notch-like protein
MENKYSIIKEIEKIINSLKTKDSFGYDGISTKILTLSAPFISSPINYICNRMQSQGVFPDRFKYATVIPLYKKGDRRNTSNYRPVSVLTSFSKTFETVMLTRISTHFSKYNILSSEQHGFRTGLLSIN